MDDSAVVWQTRKTIFPDQDTSLILFLWAKQASSKAEYPLLADDLSGFPPRQPPNPKNPKTIRFPAKTKEISPAITTEPSSQSIVQKRK